MSAEQYLDINRNSWNRKVAVHLASEFYNQEAFMEGASTLNDIELKFLGDVKGKSILHLQCHFGQDTLSLARMGATVTGVDLSDVAIDTARDLATQLELSAAFVCSDIYELPEKLDGHFDIVFTSYGTIGWLPDLQKWAGVIRHFLKPGGQFLIAEFHPVVWMFDYDFSNVQYSYFNTEPIIETLEGTYADKNADLKLEYVSWNHHLSEIFTALLQNGMHILHFEEYDYSPYNCFNNTIEVGEKQFRIAHMKDRIPMVFAISATTAVM